MVRRDGQGFLQAVSSRHKLSGMANHVGRAHPDCGRPPGPGATRGHHPGEQGGHRRRPARDPRSETVPCQRDFGTYCLERWGFTRTYAYPLIRAVSIAKNLGRRPGEGPERHLHELDGLPPEAQPARLRPRQLRWPADGQSHQGSQGGLRSRQDRRNDGSARASRRRNTRPATLAPSVPPGRPLATKSRLTFRPSPTYHHKWIGL
jgi:hypothetical protein